MVSKEFESILKKYENQKLNTYRVLEIIGSDYTFNDFGADQKNNRYLQLYNCGTQLYFEKETGTKTIYHLRAANFCRQRVCPMCQFRKSEKMFAQMLQVVKVLEDEYRFIHIVLTIPNSKDGSELSAGINTLYKAYNMTMQRKAFKNAYKGALRCLEISYNYNNDTFHPHLHCLIAVNKSYFTDSKIYISRDKLMCEWTKSVKKTIKTLNNAEYINKECEYQVFVRACKVGDYEGVAEVCKYCMKPLQLKDSYKDEQNKRILLTLWHSLKCTRFVQKYGVIKNCFAELFGDNQEEVENLEDSKGVDNNNKLFLQWDCKSLNYARG